MKCPYCEETNAQSEHMRAETYCRNYGSATFYFQCPHCREIYSVYFYVLVKHHEPCQTSGKSVADLSYQ